MRILRIITVLIILVGIIMHIKNINMSNIVLMIGVVLGLFLAVKNYQEKKAK